MSKKREMNGNKTNVKAMGLKSMLVFDNDRIAISSFKNDKKTKRSHIELITDHEGKDIKDALDAFDTIDGANGKDFLFEKEKFILNETTKKKETGRGIVINPATQGTVGQDYLGAKGVIEREYFGKEFANDNVHIQIAYNLMDVAKILNLYINNIIYMCYNFNRKRFESFEQVDDLVGTLFTGNSYETQLAMVKENSPNDADDIAKFNEFDRMLDDVPQYADYFGGLFKKYEDENENSLEGAELQAARSHNYDVFRMISFLRQFCMHKQVNKDKLKNSNLFQSYEADKGFLQDFLDKFFAVGIQRINDNFNETSAPNLAILSKVLGKSDDLLAQKYYDYVVYREGKNIGVNVTLLRECIIDNYYSALKDNRHNSYRSKMYNIFNFVLYTLLSENKKQLEEMVESLRGQIALSEEAKKRIYNNYAQIVYTIGRNKLDNIYRIFVDFKYESIENKKYHINHLDTNEVSYFAKVMYFLSKFLDGKETNELICAMINKFDNIADLSEVTYDITENKIEYSDKYAMLDNDGCVKLALDLRLAKNLAQMREDAPRPKDGMLIDALNILNIKSSANDFAQQHFHNEITIEKKGKFGKNKQITKIDTRLKNFLENNVVKSRWFFYVVKYNNPQTCCKLMSSENVLRFALKDLPETQVDRYYTTITGKEKTDVTTEMNTIITSLINFDVDKVLTKVEKLTNEEYKKENGCEIKDQSRAIVGLYLTVIYLITKSLVKVNSQFAIGIHCLERDSVALLDNGKFDKSRPARLEKKFFDVDSQLFEAYENEYKKIKSVVPKNDDEKKAQSLRLRDLDQKEKANIKAMHYQKRDFLNMRNNLEEYNKLEGDEIFKSFRNNIAHLNVINNVDKYIEDNPNVDSYFGLYCYVAQRMLCESNKQLAEYEKNIVANHTYSKDLMWIVNFPFAYNFARYKKLSNEYIYNLQYTKGKVGSDK